MPNTRAKRNKRARQIAAMDLSPGTVFGRWFHNYTVQAYYNDTVYFWFDSGFLQFEPEGSRQFLSATKEEFYKLVTFW